MAPKNLYDEAEFPQIAAARKAKASGNGGQPGKGGAAGGGKPSKVNMSERFPGGIELVYLGSDQDCVIVFLVRGRPPQRESGVTDAEHIDAEVTKFIRRSR